MLKQMLQEFLSIRGVTAAALVSGDGFVIDSAGNVPQDTDALGALSPVHIQSFARGGQSMDTGALPGDHSRIPERGPPSPHRSRRRNSCVILTSNNDSLANVS